MTEMTELPILICAIYHNAEALIRSIAIVIWTVDKLKLVYLMGSSMSYKATIPKSIPIEILHPHVNIHLESHTSLM